MPTKKEDKQPKRVSYDVKIEALVPCTLTFKVTVDEEDYEGAIKEALKKASPNHLKQELNKRKNIKASVYTSGSLMVKHTKRVS